MWVSATDSKKIEKRKEANGLTHKLPLLADLLNVGQWHRLKEN